MTATTSKPRVLILEDEYLLASLISSILEDNGYHVAKLAKNVAIALEFVSKERLDIAVLDYNIQSDTCAPVVENLRRQHIPYIILSGNTDVEGLTNQFTDAIVMTKPFREARLLESLSTALARAA